MFFLIIFMSSFNLSFGQNSELIYSLCFVSPLTLYMFMYFFPAMWLSFSLADKFQYVSDDQSFKELLSESQGKQNVLLFFVKGLGMKGRSFINTTTTTIYTT